MYIRTYTQACLTCVASYSDSPLVNMTSSRTSHSLDSIEDEEEINASEALACLKEMKTLIMDLAVKVDKIFKGIGTQS